MKKLFKNKWSKWLPISIYEYSSVEYLMLAKINIKNGDIKTKSVKMHGRFFYTQTKCFSKPFDSDEQILKLTNPNFK